VTPAPRPGPDTPPAATTGPDSARGRQARRLWSSSLIRQNILYLIGIGGSGAGVLIAQSYAAHHLTAVANGESFSVVAVLNLLYTVSFVVNAGAAREVAATVARGVPAIQRWADLRRSTMRIGLALGAIMIPVDFLLAFLLHLPHPEVLATTVVAGPLSAFTGVQRGYLQGTRDFRRLAVNFLIYGGTVVVLSVVLLHLHLGSAAVPSATVGGVLGSSLYPRHPGAHLERAAAAHGHLIDYTVVAGAATAPLFNNVDVVAARHVLPGGSAGLYSGLSVMGKIIFFGTSSLSAVMYPRLAAAATTSARRRLLLQTLVALCAADGVALLAYGFFAKPLLRLVLGAQYAGDSAHLLLFTVGVIALTFVNLMVYYGMGTHNRHFAIVPAIGVPVLIAWLFESPPQLSAFVPRIASALLVLAVLETVLVLPGALRRGDQVSEAPPGGIP
jgi:O-antigen/teichoic acid export membrane protein